MQKEPPTVFLEGKRLYLRPVEETDLVRCQRWVNDPYIRNFLFRQFPNDALSQKKWHETRPRGMPPSDITLAIVLKRNQRHIGNMGIHEIDWVNRGATTGALIGERDCHNKGYGQEAKDLILAYAFDVLNLHRISSCVLSTNPRSLAYLKKSGYREEGRRRDRFYRHGQFQDEILLGILAEDWRKRQRKRS